LHVVTGASENPKRCKSECQAEAAAVNGPDPSPSTICKIKNESENSKRSKKSANDDYLFCEKNADLNMSDVHETPGAQWRRQWK